MIEQINQFFWFCFLSFLIIPIVYISLKNDCDSNALKIFIMTCVINIFIILFILIFDKLLIFFFILSMSVGIIYFCSIYFIFKNLERKC